jgi:hypothetical protein
MLYQYWSREQGLPGLDVGAPVVITTDSALSEGACEGTAGKRRPRDGTDTKVLSKMIGAENWTIAKSRSQSFTTLSVGIISRSSSRYMRL